jgi:cytochrome c
MKPSKILSLAVCALVWLVAAPAWAEGDAKAGKKVFNKCKTCHALQAGKNKIGPSLHGVLGNTAASVAGFKYSKAMKASGVVWTEANLDGYLAKPKQFMPGTKMVFPGLKKDQQRADVIAYLKQATQ